MNHLKPLLILGALPLAYYAGLVFAIGIGARLGPLPSASSTGSAFAHALAVMAVAALIAPALVALFASRAFLAGLLVAAPCVAELVWSLLQQDVFAKAPLMAIKDVLLVALAPAAMTAPIAALIGAARGSTSR